ncbi:hypothetical protein B0A53_00636 [Rhodotorula sp. CCFEE 5036]|nr:hypothetical protein B0A53_00636 [Rhodotorula sp. CCFEE 5036]
MTDYYNKRTPPKNPFDYFRYRGGRPRPDSDDKIDPFGSGSRRGYSDPFDLDKREVLAAATDPELALAFDGPTLRKLEGRMVIAGKIHATIEEVFVA